MQKITGVAAVCVVFLQMLAACNYTGSKVQYNIAYDTVTHIPPYSQYGIYEDSTCGVCFYCKPKGCDYLLVYRRTHSGWVEHARLKIPAAYADTIDIDNAVSKWTLVNTDTAIAYVNYRHFTFLDLKHGKVIRSVPVLSDTAFDVRCFNHLQWNSRRKSLGLMYFGLPSQSVEHMKMMAEYSLERGTRVFPFTYPYEITQTYLVNYSCESFAVFHGDTMVVAFQTSPMMLCHDIKRNTTDSLYIKNKYYSPLPIPDTARINEISAPNYLYEVLLTRFFYATLVYDPYNEVYYRFFCKDMPMKDREGLITTWNDKVFGVTLIDKHFNIIGDVCFAPGEYKICYYPTREGLLHVKQYDEKTIFSLLTFRY